VFILPLMLTMVFPLFSRKLRRGKLIDAMPVLLELSELLRTPLVSEGLQREYIRRVLPRRKRPSLFIADAEGVPLMKATCEAIEVMKKLNIPDARFDPMVKWISQCESTSGGVCRKAGTTSRCSSYGRGGSRSYPCGGNHFPAGETSCNMGARQTG